MKATFFSAAAASILSVASAQQFVLYTPGGDDTTVQRADPILAPDAISQHTHQIFGASNFSPNMTYESLTTDPGCTTMADASNNAILFDNSVYWVPALYAESNNGSGWIRIPTNGHKLYYKNAGSKNDILASPFEFPKGFRMLAGSAMQRAPAVDLQQQNITQWICHDSTGTNQGTSGGFPTGVKDCDAVDGFNGAIHFPHCWNGAAFNQATPTSHIAYPDGDIENGECPASHPTRLPHIFIENTFNIHQVVNDIKPDTFTLAMGDNTGYGWHADFFNGWTTGAIPELLSTCPQGEYGNEDVGDCPSFQKRSTPANQCTLTNFYPEEVTYPGQDLPGCNPVQTVNPALDYATAPLGVSTTNCQIASNSTMSGNSTAPSVVPSMVSSATVGMSSAGSYGSPTGAGSASSTAKTTFATSIMSSAAAGSTATAGTGSGSAPNSVTVVSAPVASESCAIDQSTVTVTDVEMVTATVTLTLDASPTMKARAAHNAHHFAHGNSW